MVVDFILSEIKCISTTICDGMCYLIHNQLPLVIAVVFFVVGIVWHRCNKKSKRRQKWESIGKDVVVLHGFPRSKVSPNLSPFVLKLETYLRMTNIKYEFDDIEIFGPKGKTPWIHFNGKVYTDSELIITMLNKKFSHDLNSHLNEKEKATSRFMKVMLDEHMFWAIEYWLTADPSKAIFTLMDIPFYYAIFYPLFKYQLQKTLITQGLGRHSDKEIVEMIRKNFHALSLYLGDNSFMMGPHASEVDTSAFGFLAHFLLAQPGSPFQAMVEKTYPNLQQYVMRMKKLYYKDWTKLLAK